MSKIGKVMLYSALGMVLLVPIAFVLVAVGVPLAAAIGVVLLPVLAIVGLPLLIIALVGLVMFAMLGMALGLLELAVKLALFVAIPVAVVWYFAKRKRERDERVSAGYSNW